MQARIIKSEKEYELALERIEEIFDSSPNSPEGDELELLSMLVEMYENSKYRISLPDPIDAIKFRMEQQNLKQKDLAPFIGSTSKVSEVLSRKRNLSLHMIRSLNEGLGIPAEVLINETNKKIPAKKFDYRKFPFTEMFKRRYFPWFSGSLNRAKEQGEEILNRFFCNLNIKETENTLYRKTINNKTDYFALFAWRARILSMAKADEIANFCQEKLTVELIEEITHLSYFKKGPVLAKELLNKKGIHLLILKHLPKTYVDGAVMFSTDNKPIVCLTLRHNRLDNFWFTLLHELSHVYLHLKNKNDIFIDNLDEEIQEKMEIEADNFAQNILIKESIWKQYQSQLLLQQNLDNIEQLAEELHISPTIIAGRIRKVRNDYKLYSSLINQNKIRVFFPEY